MSQLKLKQILELSSTSPVTGDVLTYNSSTRKYENSALPDAFNGTSGRDGGNGTSGSSGTNGTSGTNGSSGSSGTN